MPDTVPILAEFDRLRMALENGRFSLSTASTPWSTEPPDFAYQMTEVVEAIRQHHCQRPEFYTKFDYEWTLSPTSYSAPLEARYQLFVLQILSEVPADHPSESRFNNIAVRFLASGMASSESIQVHDFRYIVIATSFLKMIQEYVWLLWQLAEIGESDIGAKHTAADHEHPDHFRGHAIEAALRTHSPAVHDAIDRFLAVAFAYAGYNVPSVEPVLLSAELLKTTKGFELITLFEMVEAFMICHELAHVLEHDFSSMKRSVSEEIEADISASSMYISHNARNMQNPWAMTAGPAAFFQLMRLLILVRRTASGFRRDAAAAADDVMAEKELKLRLRLYDFYNKGWGIAASSSTTFLDIAKVFYLPIAGCQLRLLNQLGVERPLTFDDLM